MSENAAESLVERGGNVATLVEGLSLTVGASGAAQSASVMPPPPESFAGANEEDEEDDEDYNEGDEGEEEGEDLDSSSARPLEEEATLPVAREILTYPNSLLPPSPPVAVATAVAPKPKPKRCKCINSVFSAHFEKDCALKSKKNLVKGLQLVGNKVAKGAKGAAAGVAKGASKLGSTLAPGIHVRNDSPLPILLVLSQLSPLHWSRVEAGETVTIDCGRVFFTASCEVYNGSTVPTAAGVAARILTITAVTLSTGGLLGIGVVGGISGMTSSKGTKMDGVLADGRTLVVNGVANKDGVFELMFQSSEMA